MTLGLLTACTDDPWTKYPMPSPPDKQCRTGHEAGYSLYIWECHEDQRIVILQYGTFLMRREPEKQTSTCGEKTSIERKLANKACKPFPPGRPWP